MASREHNALYQPISKDISFQSFVDIPHLQSQTLRKASFTRASVINPFFHMFSINDSFVSPEHRHAILMMNRRLATDVEKNRFS